MHQMQTIVTDVSGVCLSVTNDSCSASQCVVIWCNLCQIILASCYTLELEADSL